MDNRLSWTLRPHNLWRWPLVLLLRAPTMLLGYGLTALGSGLIWLGDRVPGFTEFPDQGD